MRRCRANRLALASYGYDALGRRDIETYPDLGGKPVGVYAYFSPAGDVLEERWGNHPIFPPVEFQYVWGPEGLVLRDQFDAGVPSQRVYAQQDPNGDVTSLTAGPAVVQRYLYDPYGQATVLNADGLPTASPQYSWQYLFQGGRRDPISGLYQFGARDYNTGEGRWLQRDPIGFAGGDTNLYNFVGNDPVGESDPSGLVPPGPLEDSLLQIGDLTPRANVLRTDTSKDTSEALAVVAAQLKGGDVGLRNAAAVELDTFTAGMLAHEQSVRAQNAANESRNLVDQIGYGIGKVGARAAQAALALFSGGAVAPFLSGTPVGAFLGSTPVAALGTATAAGGAAYSGVQSGRAFARGDVINGIDNAGTAVIGGLIAGSMVKGLAAAATQNTLLSRLQAKFDELADTHLLPNYKAIDPDLEWGYTGSFKTGTVNNPKKPTFGQPINLSDFDIDVWIKSDILRQIYGTNLRADVAFRKILSNTPGFEGLRPNKLGFSIKFLPSS